MRAVHLTNSAEKIKKNGFDLSKSGTGAGNNWGKGAYFLNKSWEQSFYSNRLSTEKGVLADINTDGFLKVKFKGVTKDGQMYDIASKSFTADEQKLYAKLKKKSKKEAFNSIAEKNYKGLIIEQDSNAIDPLTGGNQVVVYDMKRISNIENYEIKNKNVDFYQNEDLQLSSTSRGIGSTSTSNT